MTLHITNQTQQIMIDHALRDHPIECCGILLGLRRENETHIHQIIEAKNIAPEQREKNYQIDWQTLIQTVKTTRQNPKHAEQIVGFYHSHPDGSTQPSSLDRELAWIDHSYVIISLHTNAPPTLSCWRLPVENSLFINEKLVCSSPVVTQTQLT